jgi:hypothetical protein
MERLVVLVLLLLHLLLFLVDEFKERLVFGLVFLDLVDDLGTCINMDVLNEF